MSRVSPRLLVQRLGVSSDGFLIPESRGVVSPGRQCSEGRSFAVYQAHLLRIVRIS
jgi:hypothetical protein